MKHCSEYRYSADKFEECTAVRNYKSIMDKDRQKLKLLDMDTHKLGSIRANAMEYTILIPIYLTSKLKYTESKDQIQFIYSGSSVMSCQHEHIKPLEYYQEFRHTVYHKLDKEYVLGIWLKDEYLALYHFYIDLRYLSAFSIKTNARVGSVLTENYRSYAPTRGGDWYSIYDNEVSFKYDVHLQITKGQFKRERITQEHHTLMRPEEILASMEDTAKVHRNQDGKIVSVNLHKKGDTRVLACTLLIERADKLGLNTEASIATFMLYIYMAPIFAVNMIIDILINTNTLEELRRTLKIEGIAAKQAQHYKRQDLNFIFELNVLFNRIDHKVDWEKEKHNRTDGLNVVNIDSKEIYDYAIDIFKQARMIGKKPKRKLWKEYWGTRWATMPTGSFVSQYDDDNILKKNINDPLSRNKTTVLSTCNDRSLESFLNRPAMIYATTSVKYEWDKVRALYGCDITSYLMADFSMGDCEECLPAYFPVGDNADSTYVQYIMDKMKEGVPLCYDYDDFNAQHSKGAMKAVIKAWLNVFKNFLTPEQYLAGIWTLKSLNKMIINFKDNGGEVEVLGTLYSGWRHTSFMNTVLNRIYLMKAGLAQLTTHSIHNGDDVFAVTDNIQNALLLIENAKKFNIRAQVSKMNIGTIAEFLRVDGRASTPTGAQYLTRACTTAVHSRIETTAME
nr:putative RNA-dependent RNA polymerase [Poaceae Liege totivirus 8]